MRMQEMWPCPNFLFPTHNFSLWASKSFWLDHPKSCKCGSFKRVLSIVLFLAFQKLLLKDLKSGFLFHVSILVLMYASIWVPWTNFWLYHSSFVISKLTPLFKQSKARLIDFDESKDEARRGKIRRNVKKKE